MANVYLRIDKLEEVKGSATLEDIGGKKGWMPVDHMNFGLSRDINIEVGAATSGEMGSFSFSNIEVSRDCDGASAYLQTLFFAPGADGKTIELIVTKSDREGKGMVPSLIITLTGARLSHYSLAASERPAENFSIAYVTVSIKHYLEEADGTIKQGDTVGFDLAKATLTSKANL